VLAAATGSDWNAGGSILTFYFPVGLFLVIAAILCLQFGRPHTIPGRRPLAVARTSANGRAVAAATAATAGGDADAGHDEQHRSGAEGDHEPPAAGA